jgi:tetratricopeptide repeat protein 30
MQARIYWDKENYVMVERLLTQSAEFCGDHEVWRLNVAHVFFMQDTRFKDAIKFYDPIVKRLSDSLLDITAIILANLCVSYIMSAQNEEAEDLMRRIEKEEERLNYTDPDKHVFHLCIVNLGEASLLWFALSGDVTNDLLHHSHWNSLLCQG